MNLSKEEIQRRIDNLTVARGNIQKEINSGREVLVFEREHILGKIEAYNEILAAFDQPSPIAQLLEDYERRLKTLNNFIGENLYKSPSELKRLRTKAGTYRTFIAELKKLTPKNS